MKSKGSFIDSLKLFCKEVGVPLSLVCDPSGEQTSQQVRGFCHQVGTTLRVLQEATQWANRAELYIGLFKESVFQDIRRSNSPMSLWDYCLEHRVRLHNVTPKNLFQLNGLNPHTAIFGTQPNPTYQIFVCSIGMIGAIFVKRMRCNSLSRKNFWAESLVL